MTLTWTFFFLHLFILYHLVVLVFFFFPSSEISLFYNKTQSSNSLLQNNAFWPSWNGTCGSVGFSAAPVCKLWLTTVESAQDGWGSPWLHKDPWFSDFLNLFFLLFTIGVVILTSMFVVKSKRNNLIKAPGPERMCDKSPPATKSIAAPGKGSVPTKSHHGAVNLFYK